MLSIKYEYNTDTAYVADDGNYGVGTVITFDYAEFHRRYPNAWELVDQMSDYYRNEFILAILDQNEDELKEFAQEYEFDLADVLDKE
jgi:hypothetical protein